MVRLDWAAAAVRWIVRGPVAMVRPLKVEPMVAEATSAVSVMLLRTPAVPSRSFFVPHWVVVAMRSMEEIAVVTWFWFAASWTGSMTAELADWTARDRRSLRRVWTSSIEPSAVFAMFTAFWVLP